MKPQNILLIISLWVIGIMPISAQTITATDSLSLKNILNSVLNNFPALRKNQQEINAADARIGLAKTAYNPDVNFSSSYSHIGPVSSINFPGLGEFELYPSNNYSAAVNYNQMLYDFGKTAKNIELENQSKTLVGLSTEQIKQKLSLSVVSIYYVIVYLQEAVKIKDEQLKTLNEHLLFVEKKKATGSATQYDVLTTKVRISAIENQKTDLLSALKIQICQMNSLIGQPEKTTLLVREELQDIVLVSQTDSLISTAMQMRQELKMVQQKTVLLEQRYKTVNTLYSPVLNVFASGGVKNGYVPDLNKGKLNYVVGVGLRIPMFDAGRTKYNLLQIKADIESSKEDYEISRRTIVNEVVETETGVETALQKITQTGLQMKQAEQANALAETSFKSGVITNLELLDNSTALSEAKLQNLKAKIDYSVSLLKFKISLGEKLY